MLKIGPMKNIVLKSFLSFLITACLIFPSCSRRSFEKKLTSETTVEKGAIPADFGKSNFTLLYVGFGREKVDNIVKEVLENEYHGKYEAVSNDEYQQNMRRYNDSTKYQYVLTISSSTTSHISVTSDHSGDMTFLHIHYLLIDAKTKKTYNCPATVNWYEHVMKVYIQSLENQRKKNQTS